MIRISMDEEKDVGEKVSVPINIRVPVLQYERWRYHAYKKRKSMAAFVRDAVEAVVRAMEKTEK